MPGAGRPREFDIDAALDAAIVVFWRDGYEGAGLSDLTVAMGISRASLYAAFGSKGGLFDRALDRYVDRHLGYVEDALSQPTAYGTAEAFLLGNVRAVTVPGQPAGCLTVQASVTSGTDDAFARLTRHRIAAERRLAERFGSAVRDGDLGPDEDPDALAAFLITLTTGFAIRAADGAPRSTLLAVARTALAGFPRVGGRRTSHHHTRKRTA